MNMGSEDYEPDSCYSSACSLPDNFLTHQDSMSTIDLEKSATSKEATGKLHYLTHQDSMTTILEKKATPYEEPESSEDYENSSACSLPDYFMTHKDSLMTTVLGKIATPSKEATVFIATPCIKQPIKKEGKKEKAWSIRNFFSKLLRVLSCKRNGRGIATETLSDPSCS